MCMTQDGQNTISRLSFFDFILYGEMGLTVMLKNEVFSCTQYIWTQNTMH